MKVTRTIRNSVLAARCRRRNPRRDDCRESAGHRRHPHLSHGVRGDGGEHHLRHPDGEGGREPHRRRAGNPRLHLQRAGDGGGAPVEEAGLRHRGCHHPARDPGRQRGARAVPARAHPHQVQAPARGKLLVAGQVLRHHQPRHQVHRGHEGQAHLHRPLRPVGLGRVPVPAPEARLRHRRDELRHPQAQPRRPHPAAHRRHHRRRGHRLRDRPRPAVSPHHVVRCASSRPPARICTTSAPPRKRSTN